MFAPGGILDVDRHALPITLGMLVVSAAPGAIEVIRHRRR